MDRHRGNTESFIDDAKKIHGKKYDYSKVKYDNSDSKVEIVCPIHGSFSQRAANHLLGRGCPECSKDKTRSSNEEFIKKAKKIFKNTFDYSKVNYRNNYTPIEIICKKHGPFFQQPSNHLLGQGGCPQCAIESRAIQIRLSKDEFLKRVNQIHKGKYEYPNLNFLSTTDLIKIKCPIHGEFEQRASDHMDGRGCPKCAGQKRTTDEFIDLARKTHGDKYDYSVTDYKIAREKVDIRCPIHGIFTQRPMMHVKGQGCPVCNESSGENFIYNLLNNLKIKFIREKKFSDCFHKSESGRCTSLEFDFYLPKTNTCIEYDGKQHFEPIAFYGGEEGFKKSVKRDKIKNQYCKKNGIKLIRIPYTMKKEEIEPYILKELGIK